MDGISLFGLSSYGTKRQSGVRKMFAIVGAGGGVGEKPIGWQIAFNCNPDEKTMRVSLEWK